MDVEFCSFRNGVIPLEVESTDKVEYVEQKVEDREGIAPAEQRLIFAGKQDEKTLAEYGVKAGSVLHMVMRLRGC